MKLKRTYSKAIVCLVTATFGISSIWAEQIITEDLKVEGVITSDDQSAPPMLYLKGAAASGATGGDVGLSLSYYDATTGLGIQRINRQQAEWRWQTASPYVGTGWPDRVQMKLDDSDALTLFDPANDSNTIVIAPGGATPGIYIFGDKVATLSAVAASYVPMVAGGLTVTGTGAVGIGTLFPAEMLSVNGNIELASPTSATAGQIKVNGTTRIQFYGTDNFFVGGSTGYAGNYTMTGTDNISMGAWSGISLTTGVRNIGIGLNTLLRNSTGNANVAVGMEAGYNILGDGNIAIGAQAVYGAGAGLTGGNNIGIGATALAFTSSGYENVAVGIHAMLGNVTGVSNTALGAYADVGAPNLSNATAVGYCAVVDTSNSLVLGATGNKSVNVGIGTTAPSSRFHVVGDSHLEGGLQVDGRIRVAPQGDIAMGDFIHEPAP